MKAQYYKSSAANFFNDEEKGCLYGASGVAERIPEYSSDKSRPLSASYAHKSDSMGGVKSDAFPDNPVKQVFDFIAEKI